MWSPTGPFHPSHGFGGLQGSPNSSKNRRCITACLTAGWSLLKPQVQEPCSHLYVQPPLFEF